MENPVVAVLSVLEDWLIVCVYVLGADKTRSVMAHAIDKAYQLAISIVRQFFPHLQYMTSLWTRRWDPKQA